MTMSGYQAERPFGERQRGLAFLEAVLIAPVVVASLLGIMATNILVSSGRSVQWSVGEALIENNLFMSPKLSGGQRVFTQKYLIADRTFANEGSHPFAVTEENRCSGGVETVQCAAWETMKHIAQAVQSSQTPTMLSELELRVAYSNYPQGDEVPLSMRRLKRVSVQVKGRFNEETAGRLRAVAGLSFLFPGFTVTRTEALG
jgi:hypothetical protein